MALKLMLFLTLCFYKLLVYISEGQFCVGTVIIGMFQQSVWKVSSSLAGSNPYLKWSKLLLEQVINFLNIYNINLCSYSFNTLSREHEWRTRKEHQKKGFYFQWIETDPQAFTLRNNCLRKQRGQQTQSISFIWKNSGLQHSFWKL